MRAAKETVDRARSLLTPDCIVIEAEGELFALVKQGAPLAYDGKHWTLCLPLIAEMVKKVVNQRFSAMYREAMQSDANLKE